MDNDLLKYKKLSPIEHVLKRAGMYIGAIQTEAVVPAIMVAGREFGRSDLTHSSLRMFAEDYAQRLYQKADELEQK